MFKISGFAERIKYIRNQKGLSQAKFAAIIGASQGNIGDWERGKTLPGAVALLSMIKKFNISADWLLTGEEPAQGVLTELNLFDQKDTLSEEEQILIATYRQLPERWKGHIEGVIAAYHIHKSD